MIEAKAKLNEALEKGAETTEYLKAYVNYQIQLKKLENSDKVGQSISSIVNNVVIGFLGLSVVFFLLFSLAYYLAEQNILSLPLAFMSIAGGILVLLVLFLLLKKVMVTNPIETKISHAFFKDGKPNTSEAELKRKIQQLEKMIQDSTQKATEPVKNLTAKDFVPEQVAENKLAKKVLGLEKKTDEDQEDTLGKVVGKFALKFVKNQLKNKGGK